MIKTGNPIISIYTEMTPNPETMKFVANKLLYPGKSIDFPDASLAGPSPLAAELFGFPFLKAVFIASNFVTLTKTPETEWNDVIPAVREFLNYASIKAYRPLRIQPWIAEKENVRAESLVHFGFFDTGSEARLQPGRSESTVAVSASHNQK